MRIRKKLSQKRALLYDLSFLEIRFRLEWKTREYSDTVADWDVLTVEEEESEK